MSFRRLAIAWLLAAAILPAATVPFVGCPSDGQLGAQPAPEGKPVDVAISTQAAERLAYYKPAYGPAVLGPRGWFCFGTYGSSGETVFVSPQPIDGAKVLSGDWGGFTGPAIQLSNLAGDTSGRFTVAQVIARAFPAHLEFVDRVKAEHVWPADSFPSGSYPRDRLNYKSKEVVEFETAANAEGLGTHSWLKPNSSPIRGVAILAGETPSLIELTMRLPEGMEDLGSAITQQVERDAATDQ